jgi:hypothetical protein
MATILINLTESERLLFKTKVGNGNVSSSIRQYIQNMISTDDDIPEQIKRNKLKEIKEKKDKIDIEYEQLKAELLAIEQKKKEKELAELEAFEKEKQKMSDIKHDTLKANLYRMV